MDIDVDLDTMTDEEFSAYLESSGVLDSTDENDSTDEVEDESEVVEEQEDLPEVEDPANTDDMDEADADEDTDEGTADPKTGSKSTTTYKYVVNGEELEFSDEEIKAQFGDVLNRAMDRKPVSPSHKKILDAISTAELNEKDINFAIDLLAGNKAALAALLQKHKVDAFDLEETDGPYVPQSYGRSESELEIAEVTGRISKDPEYDITHRILTKEWDEDSWAEFSKRPMLIELLHRDVKSGAYKELSGISKRLKLQDELRYGTGIRSDLEYYKLAVNIAATPPTPVEPSPPRRQLERDDASLRKVRKAAVNSKVVPGGTQHKKPVDTQHLSDDEFVKWFESNKG